ncbi:MAG: metallophosphoesterase family protein [Microthrixaceae bacterium]
MGHSAELFTVADDEVVLWHGAQSTRITDLSPDSEVVVDGQQVRTLPRHGELLARIATVNDVHFGETEAGRLGDSDEWETFSVAPGKPPYPQVMNAGAVHDISSWEPDLVVVKGDLTSSGAPEQYEEFRACYEPPFGDRLLAVRGNHESYHHLAVADDPFQERELPGVHVALLDTTRDGEPNGDLTAEQLDRLDELAARADRSVLVFGHHPIWDSSSEARSDDTFGLLPAATEALIEVFARRPRLVGYFAGHTHRNRVLRVQERPDVPFAEVACVKDFPGSWAEYRVFDGGILQVHRRISTPDALAWTERTRGMFGGAYPAYASGRLDERCFEVSGPAAHR